MLVYCLNGLFRGRTFKYENATSPGHAVIECGTVDAARRRAVPENEPPDSYGFRANVR